MLIALTLIKWSVFVYGHLHYTQYSKGPTVLAVCYGDDWFLVEKWEEAVLNRREMVMNFYDFLQCFQP